MSAEDEAAIMEFDPETGTSVVLNDTGVSNADVWNAISTQSPEVAALVRWGQNTRGGGIFDRDKYVNPPNIFDQFRVAQDAVADDDVVSGVLETTESLAFNKIDFEAIDEDEEDVWNQVAEEIDLDARLREMWAELFTVSQFYVGMYWGKRSYKVRGKSEKGVSRKRTFDNLTVPIGLTLLDPLKIVPVGSMLFNKEQLCWMADRAESDDINAVLAGLKQDPLVSQLISAKFEPSEVERRALAPMMPTGYAVDRLYLLNPDTVFRHTATRSQYKRFADVRMRSVFELLDLKHQLRQMDRAHLLGGTNFIVVVTKGSDKLPAKPQEIENLQSQVRMVARVPVIVGDHRLEVKIVTPNTDNTLSPDRYNGLDARITARLFQMFMTGNFSAGAKGDDSIKLARVVARGLAGRRNMLKRTIEAKIIRPMLAKNTQLTSDVSLRFHPRRIDLDFDPAWSQYILQLFDRGAVSRETMLDEADFDQTDEARKREKEAAKFDKIFTPPASVPIPGVVTSPGNSGTKAPNSPGQRSDPKAGGINGGGLRNGGGRAPGSGQGQSPRNPAKKAK